jgi:SHS2 domain-containing protein
MPGFRYEEHTGELQIRLWARSLAELFEEAARALGEVMAGAKESGAASDEGDQANSSEAPNAYGVDSAGLSAGPEVARVTLEAPDREALLVDWLNEIIFRAETARKIYTQARVDRIDDRSLSAEITGSPSPSGRTFVKAATFHGLRITEVPGGLSASVLLDI